MGIPSLYKKAAAAPPATVAPVSVSQSAEVAQYSAPAPAATLAPGASTGYPAAFITDTQPPPSQAAAAAGTQEDPVVVSQNPLTKFLGDILIPAVPGVYTVDVHSIMGSDCVGFVLIPLSVGVAVSINGGGFRSVPSMMVVDESVINNLQIQIFTDGAILQLNGV